MYLDKRKYPVKVLEIVSCSLRAQLEIGAILASSRSVPIPSFVQKYVNSYIDAVTKATEMIELRIDEWYKANPVP